MHPRIWVLGFLSIRMIIPHPQYIYPQVYNMSTHTQIRKQAHHPVRRPTPPVSVDKARYMSFVNQIQSMSDGAFNQFMNNMEQRVVVTAGAQKKRGW